MSKDIQYSSVERIANALERIANALERLTSGGFVTITTSSAPAPTWPSVVGDCGCPTENYVCMNSACPRATRVTC